MPERLSIILPTLNESACIVSTLQPLQPLRLAGHEVIVVDGGSSDDTRALAGPLADRVLDSGRGRARQMNTGAANAVNNILLFLHADTALPVTAVGDINTALTDGYLWGRFDVRIVPADLLLHVVAGMMNFRSRLTGVATGDQAIFVHRHLFEVIGGYPDIGLMEDLALCDQLKQHGRPACLHSRVTTSARRWLEHGRLRTILKMWSLRLAYRLGVTPDKLAQYYK